MYKRQGSKSEDLFQPDLLPDKYESGTHNTPGIVGLNEGVKFVLETGIEKIREHEEQLCEYMLNRLEEVPNIVIYGPKNSKKRAFRALILKKFHNSLFPSSISLEVQGFEEITAIMFMRYI